MTEMESQLWELLGRAVDLLEGSNWGTLLLNETVHICCSCGNTKEQHFDNCKYQQFMEDYTKARGTE